MSHYSLGRPPLDLTRGFPAAAERIRANQDRLGARALEVALDATPGLRERYDEAGLRQLLHDATLIAERVALCVAADDPSPAFVYAEYTSALYRRRKVSMDDLIALCEGLRAALPSVLGTGRDATGRRRAGRGDPGLRVAPPAGRRRAQEERLPPVPVQGRLTTAMTVKWVQQDPLVLNGEPFCYGSRLTVRQLLELRANGYDLTRILNDHPELRRLGVAAAFTYAADHRERYADFFEADGSLTGPGYSEAEAAGLPAQYQRPGIVVKAATDAEPAAV